MKEDTNAIQEQGTGPIHVLPPSQDGQAVGKTHEEHQAPPRSQAPGEEVTAPYDVSHMYPPDIKPNREPVIPTIVEVLEGVEAEVRYMWPGMTHQNFLRFGQYLRDMGDQLGLRDWTIVLEKEPYLEDEDAAAATKCIDGQKRAKVWLSRHFAEYTPHDQKHYLIHELLHLIFDPLNRVVWTAQSLLGDSAFRILDRNHDAAIELAVDGLAVELCRLLPDIPQ